jgi:hypothetical protein
MPDPPLRPTIPFQSSLHWKKHVSSIFCGDKIRESARPSFFSHLFLSSHVWPMCWVRFHPEKNDFLSRGKTFFPQFSKRPLEKIELKICVFLINKKRPWRCGLHSGIVSACRRGGCSYGSWDWIPPAWLAKPVCRSKLVGEDLWPLPLNRKQRLFLF